VKLRQVFTLAVGMELAEHGPQPCLEPMNPVEVGTVFKVADEVVVVTGSDSVRRKGVVSFGDRVGEAVNK
jgi:F0F1-type ATP synthase alpha subunit